MSGHILHETHERSMTLATRGCLFVAIFRKDYSADEAGLLHRHQLAFARQQGAHIALLTVLDVTERHILAFSRQAREATVDLAREMAPYVDCSAVVFDRSGFAASAIRSLVTTINFISKQTHAARVFGNLDVAIEWLDSTRGTAADFDRAATAAWVRTLRQENEVASK